MAQHDYVIDNSTGANVRADINNVLQAIATNNSGSSAPSTTLASQFFADTNAGIMKLRNTSNNGYVNLFTLAGGIDVDAASNFNEDVTFQCASGTIVFDKSANDLTFSDSVKARFGDSNDLTIFHDGSNSHIEEAGTGGLLIKGDSVNIGATSGEFYFRGFENGAASLRFDNSTKVETAADRVNITGHIFISDGNLYIKNGFNNANSRLRNTGGSNDANLEFLVVDSSSETEALEITNTSHIRIPNDGKELRFGAGDDLLIKHDGSNSEIRNNTGNFILKTVNGEFSLVGRPNAETELYFDHAVKFETISEGVQVYGNIKFEGNGRIIKTGSSAHHYFIQGGASLGGGAIRFAGGSGDGDLRFSSGSNSSFTERMRFDANGNLLIGTTTTTINSSNFGIGLFQDHGVSIFKNTVGANTVVRMGGSEGLVKVQGDGDLFNTNNTYGQVSDETLKQDIVDAASQWNDIKNLRVRKFRFKDNPTGVLQIGVIAQEIEKVSAGLIQEDSDGIKSVKYSVLYMKAIKALQEAITKIETLETKVAALEAA